MKSTKELGDKAFDGEYILLYSWLHQYIALKNHLRRLNHTVSLHGSKWTDGMIRYYSDRLAWHLEEKPKSIKLPDDDTLYAITRPHTFITAWLRTH